MQTVGTAVADGFFGVWAEQHVRPDAVVVRVGGDIDHGTVEDFTNCLRAAETAVTPPSPVVLDLTAVEFFGTGAVSALLIHHLRCAKLGSQLRIIADQRGVLRPLRLTGLDTTLYVIPTLDDALPPASGNHSGASGPAGDDQHW